MGSDDPVGTLGKETEWWQMSVEVQDPTAPGCVGQRAENRLCAPRALPRRIQELNRGPEILRWNLRKPRRDLLVRKIGNGVPCYRLPAPDPPATETAISIEDQEGTLRLFHTFILVRGFCALEAEVGISS